MVGVGVELPALPSAAGLAARLAARGVRPRRVSAKRSWPPGCGRFAAPPPPAPAAAGDGEKGAEGRTDEAVTPAAVPLTAPNGASPPQGQDAVEAAAAPAAVSPAAPNGAPPPQGQDRAEAAAAPAAVSPAVQNGAPPPHGQDETEAAAAPAAVSPAAQNGALPQQGENKMEEAVASATVSAVERNGVLQHALPSQGSEQVDEKGDKGDNSEIGSLMSGANTASLDVQEGTRMAKMAAPMVDVLQSSIAGSSSSTQNGGEGAGLFVLEKEQGSSGDALRDEAAAAADGRENGNRQEEEDLERKVDGVEGIRKRWLTSALNPPPKRRAVSAVRRFPPGCGRKAVTAKGSGVSEVSPIRTSPSDCKENAVTTNGSGILEVSPVRTVLSGCGNAAITTDGTEVLEVLPIRAYPSDHGGASVTTIGSGDVERMPLGATPVANGDASAIEALAALPDSGGAINEKVEGKRVVDEGSSKAHNKIQGFRVANKFSLVDSVGAKQSNDEPPNVFPKASPKHGFTDKIKGSISPREGKQVTQVAGDNKMRSKLAGSLQKDIYKTPMKRAIDANTKGKGSSGNLDIAEASKERNMQKKTFSSKKELMPSNAIVKEHKFARKPKGDDTSKNTLQQSNQVEENGNMDIIPGQMIVQALMAPEKCPWTQGKKSIVRASKSHAPRKKVKGKVSPPKKLLQLKVVNDDTMDNNEDSFLEDDSKSSALVVYEEKREKGEFSVNLPPSVPFELHHGQSRDGDLDARRKVRKLLQKFQGVCRKLMQVEEQRIRNVGRIDLEAIKFLKKDPMYTKPEAIVGNVPGVEVGDEFHFRVELSLVGLHRPFQGGIDTCKVNGVLVAISIVASGGYPDELSSSGELIYTGSGGKATGKKDAEDQKLERGNLALKNCIESKTPVRVIHGFKGQSSGEVSHSKSKQVSTFTYDGLYNVVDCWQENLKGSMIFKYKLHRIPGQPQLALHIVKVTKKSKVREGILLPDISHGVERIPICVINTIDSLMPAPFKYITEIIYPPWYKKEPPTGCDCTNGCSDSDKCACAMKNGGEIPYNFNGAIVEAKTLMYECGPSCRCPPTCHNRVSQHGIKIPLEIFKTGKTGWGVRSLSSISSGSFICEYAGELLQDKEAEMRENDEYLFDIGHNYHDEELWEGLKSIPGLESSTSSTKTMEGFTIDAAECGNVGRFINHSCSPNLYAQNVLWDHDDVEKPHVMLFAVENIPPLQELTYHYNYSIGQVQDKNGKEKIKHCYCGSSECNGRLY